MSDSYSNWRSELLLACSMIVRFPDEGTLVRMKVPSDVNGTGKYRVIISVTRSSAGIAVTGGKLMIVIVIIKGADGAYPESIYNQTYNDPVTITKKKTPQVRESNVLEGVGGKSMDKPSVVLSPICPPENVQPSSYEIVMSIRDDATPNDQHEVQRVYKGGINLVLSFKNDGSPLCMLDTLWVRWVHGIYIKDKEDIWVHQPPTDCSWYWKKINGCKEAIKR
ncbi:hypothetical protein HAX54_020598, partial [Datura stramonium]|nr:hypothetical protein [Datura stramonium]